MRKVLVVFLNLCNNVIEFYFKSVTVNGIPARVCKYQICKFIVSESDDTILLTVGEAFGA